MASTNEELASKSFQSVSSLIGLQLFSRAFTFALNQTLVRIASPEVFGTATIQFELLLSTILFLSREGVRNALLRTGRVPEKKKRGEDYSQLVTNISILPVFLGGILSVSATLIYRFLSSSSTRDQPRFDLAIILYAVAAFIELLSEPLYVRAQSELLLGVRVRAEGVAVVFKSLFTVACLAALGKEWSLVSFAVGQLAYGCAVLSVYLVEFEFNTPVWLQPVKKTVHGNALTTYFDENMLKLSSAMTGQSLVKHFLTEGDRFIVSRFSPLSDQGGYAVAVNYGSLVARIVFQPVEETSRLYFSKLLSSSASPSQSPGHEHKGPTIEEDNKILQASNVVHMVLLLYSHICIIFLAFGPPYIPVMLSFILPARYMSTSAPRVLQAYCAYLPVMAVNGFLEAFISSTASAQDLTQQSRAMGLFSMLFIGAAVGFGEGLGWKETGLVYANVVNLGARAAYGWWYVRIFFGRMHRESNVDWRRAIPPYAVLALSGIGAVVVRVSAALYGDTSAPFKDKSFHFGIGMLCFTAWVAVCVITERRVFIRLIKVVRDSKR